MVRCLIMQLLKLSCRTCSSDAHGFYETALNPGTQRDRNCSLPTKRPMRKNNRVTPVICASSDGWKKGGY